VNVDPFDARLDDELERARLRRVFEQKLDTVVGYVLPLQADPHEQRRLSGPTWSTGPWFLRADRMYLIPGDSPMGYRLPLDALPWVSKGDYPYVVEQDPMAPRDALPAAEVLQARHAQGPVEQRAEARRAVQDPRGPAAGSGAHVPGQPEPAAFSQPPGKFQSAADVTRTALCVEVRDPRRANGPKAEAVGSKSGVLYVFMPPLTDLADYLALVAAIEATTEELGLKIVMEGYPPPRDHRLKLLQVTPDPGVIEVNIHPAHNWAELVDHTEFLYEAAFETRLSAEKFMTDGRHTGTGGGNHFVLGGATPADSPFLRRPELLGSLLLYWHNHPSLSYLFSGLFIGPTSQAPRVDEARNDQLYELEVALREIERNRQVHGQDMPPWLVDRSLRNILVDVTGNTHRSEFCIDKLYSPDSTTGRLGLLELRAFEMPPHARMSIVQQLLLRALIARFWNKPYKAPVTRWGTQLHDRWLLPTFIQSDFHDVLQEMRGAGYDFDDAWFAPHFEFRFPLVGSVSAAGVELTLRNALEPWHVLGEEGAVGGTVRYVDSSLERLEVRVTGLNESRYVVTVNGKAVPLQPTGTAGEFVAGVRYRAWNPPSALHPTIGVHAPLTFDLVDTWMNRSLGGCQYHVAHPGGRNYVTFPVNAYEAESRRLARFFRMGHTPGRLHVAEATVDVAGSREFPFTPRPARREAAWRHLAAHRRLRPRPRARRQLVGGVAAHAGAFRPGLPARKPARHHAPVPAGLRGAARAAPGRHLQRHDGRPAAHVPGRRAAAHRAAHARPLQRDLLRARLPGALPRRDAGRGQRPHGARPAPLPQDPAGPAAGARPHQAAGRPVPRPARAAPGFDAGRARPAAGHPRRQCAGGQHAGLGLSRIACAAGFPARRWRAASSAKSSSCRRCRPGGAANAPRSRRRCRNSAPLPSSPPIRAPTGRPASTRCSAAS
jgi:uncharacterized protein (DUF2126 family)